MKTINKTRFTNKFCISSCHIADMAKIDSFVRAKGERLVAIVNDGSVYIYTARVTTPGHGCYDATFSVGCSKVCETERVWIAKEIGNKYVPASAMYDASIRAG